ncbi:MAG: prepilin-type N-terminal cleavage/methylation domain-containing protein [Pseudomonadales bacterium]|nr:prepilin-type N-terminal cleavage/methylation domain-containing protein [Pseudomonadales bacterium]
MRVQRVFVQGFTLVELVVVIVLMGILSVGTVSFIGDSSSGYASTIRRTELASNARLSIERISRELRDILPNSARLDGAGCIEFVPVQTASTYLDLPVVSAAISFKAIPLEPTYSGTADRVVVYPGDTNSAYAVTASSAISPVASISAPDANNQITVSFASMHRFPVESPSKRFFLVAGPVSFCMTGGNLYRYSGYGMLSSQPGVSDLPATFPGRVPIGENVLSETSPFSLSEATLLRNAVVLIDLSFRADSDFIRVNHQIQLRNVP